MIRHQRGFTFIGFLITAFIGICIALVGFKIIPSYIEYYNIVHSMQSLQSQSSSIDTENNIRYEIRKALQRRFEVNAITSIASKDVKIFSQRSNQYELIADYNVKVPLVSNISLLIHFKKSVVVSLNDNNNR